MELQEAQALTEIHMEQYGLLQRGWRFEFDRKKTRFGVCSHGRKVIGLSKVLVELNCEEVVEKTILHEIAHAIVGYEHMHDDVWRAKAIELGDDGEQCYKTQSQGGNVTPTAGRWKLQCRGCGFTWSKQYYSKPRRKLIHHCNGSINDIIAVRIEDI